jgi:hypothetical protein
MSDHGNHTEAGRQEGVGEEVRRKADEEESGDGEEVRCAEDRSWRGERAGPEEQQLGQRKYPEPPLPAQHLKKPGNEYELEPRPAYEAPHTAARASSMGRSR